MENLRVKELLKIKHLRYQDVADALGVSLQAVKIMLNSKNPTLSTLEKLAGILDVPISELFAPAKYGQIVCPHCGGVIKLRSEKMYN